MSGELHTNYIEGRVACISFCRQGCLWGICESYGLKAFAAFAFPHESIRYPDGGVSNTALLSLQLELSQAGISDTRLGCDLGILSIRLQV